MFKLKKEMVQIFNWKSNWFPHYLHMLRAARRLVPKEYEIQMSSHCDGIHILDTAK
jgi:negative regulator of sigma E activity